MVENYGSSLPRSRLLKGNTLVTSIVIAMLLILAVAIGTAGVVLVGMEGRGRRRAPKLADRMARAAQHLNGDGQPPETLVRLLR